VSQQRFCVVGPGRAGGSIAGALVDRGWIQAREVTRMAGAAQLERAAHEVDLVVIATPDSVIAPVAAGIEPNASAVVVHLAGSFGLDVLLAAGHQRVGALHPLVSMPSAEIGRQRLVERAWFAVAGDPLVEEIVAVWGGRSFNVADADRAAYHAAACIASNHLVALFGQVERVAATAGVPLAAYLPLALASLANVEKLGPAAALTGPAARNDLATIDRHRAALASLDSRELAAYDAMVELARVLQAP